jgi:hypothetical protein
MFESSHQPIAERTAFLRRLARYCAFSALIIVASLALGVLGYHYLGVLGYHYLGAMPWIDALLNASMILGGMGPTAELSTTGAKLFASFYALFSGMVLLVSVGVLAAPIVHRFLHHFHMDIGD